ncbi:MAG: exopolysaccharide biosynthesis protein, partial [Brevundimonas sp.]
DGLFVIAGAAVTTAWLTLLGVVATGLLLGAEWATRLLPG